MQTELTALQQQQQQQLEQHHRDTATDAAAAATAAAATSGPGDTSAEAPLDDLAQALRTTDFLASGPGCWGPLQWMTMHQLARGYPRENPTPAQRQALVSYMTSLAEFMPCSKCANHWRQIAPTVQQATDSRYTALKWTIDVHNAVNARLHKPVLTYAQAVQAIKDMCPGNEWRERAAAHLAPKGRVPLTGPDALSNSAIASTPLFLGVTIALGAAVLILVVVIVIGRRRAASL